ncbi:MAG: hypothetical protein VXW97_03590 [Pseudomonadota bacterium]|nr:hypothetical protein [Pseudomonadota bacterium]
MKIQNTANTMNKFSSNKKIIDFKINIPLSDELKSLSAYECKPTKLFPSM